MRNFLAVLIFSFFAFFSLSPFSFADDKHVCQLQTLYPDFPKPDLLNSLKYGFNLPNWDASSKALRPQTETLKALQKEGFQHIRLPFFHDSFDEENLTEKLLQPYLSQVRSETEKLIKLGYKVSLDLHPSAAFNKAYEENPDRHLKHMVKLWQILAESFKELNPDDVLIELLNEPATNEEIWQKHLPLLVKHVRALLPNHTLVISPYGPQRHEALSRMAPLEDDNLIYAVHFYDPFFFTHQGAEWLAEDAPERALKGVPFPTSPESPEIKRLQQQLLVDNKQDALEFLTKQLEIPWGYQDLDNAFNQMENWSERHKKPVIINEFGVLSHHAPRIARLLWLNEVAKDARERCFLWAHWDFSDGFGFVDPATGNYDRAIVNLLLNKD